MFVFISLKIGLSFSSIIHRQTLLNNKKPTHVHLDGCTETHRPPGSYSNAEVSPSFFSIDGAAGEAAGTVGGRDT